MAAEGIRDMSFSFDFQGAQLLVNDPFIDVITFEDIFLHEKRSFIQAIAHATAFTEDSYCGIELDLDVIEDTLALLPASGGT